MLQRALIQVRLFAFAHLAVSVLTEQEDGQQRSLFLSTIVLPNHAFFSTPIVGLILTKKFLWTPYLSHDIVKSS